MNILRSKSLLYYFQVLVVAIYSSFCNSVPFVDSHLNVLSLLTYPSLIKNQPHCICRGYMAPEYVVRGKLTEKADVYSFGVLVIEVVCGKRNNAFSQDSHSILQRVNHFIWEHLSIPALVINNSPDLI